jgi:catechol 2,3-dioxygenase-like lactoylglutathione lyase family enzyme
MPNTSAPGARPQAAGSSAFRGVHHLALVTDDIKATTDFFVNIVGMPLVHAMKVPPGLGTGPGNRGNPPWEDVRHYFFDMGNDSLLAYFEIPKGAMPQADRNAVGGMQHCAFVMPPEKWQALRSRLQAAGIPYDEVEPLPGLSSLYFKDPAGARLEACCQPADEDAPDVIGLVLQTKAQARRELETLGATSEWIDDVTANLPD